METDPAAMELMKLKRRLFESNPAVLERKRERERERRRRQGTDPDLLARKRERERERRRRLAASAAAPAALSITLSEGEASEPSRAMAETAADTAGQPPPVTVHYPEAHYLHSLYPPAGHGW